MISFQAETATVKEKAPKRSSFRGFSPALLCGRKSCVLLHANYPRRIVGRQAVRRWISRRPET